MKLPVVSIITVCFNSVKTIEETINSVLAQDYPQLEYIIIDGGSTDGTLKLIEQYKSHIALVVSEPDKGMYDAMNKGLQLSTGEIIGLLNADDLYAHSLVITRVAQKFVDPTVEACYGDLIYFNPSSPGKIWRYWRSNEFRRGSFAKGWNPPHPTFFARRRSYEQHGYFDLSYEMGNDIELMMRFLERYRIHSVYLPEVLVKMRIGGVSNRSLKNKWVQNKSIIKAAKRHQLPITWATFFLGKVINRVAQFILRPRSHCNDLK